MNKRFFLWQPLVGLFMFALVSCGDDLKDSVVPQYGKLVFSPSVVHAGDSVLVTAPQTVVGSGIEATTYTWSIHYGLLDETDTVIVQKTNYDGLDNGDPHVKFLVPADAGARLLTVSLNAQFRCYVGSTLFGQATQTGSATLLDPR